MRSLVNKVWHGEVNDNFPTSLLMPHIPVLPVILTAESGDGGRRMDSLRLASSTYGDPISKQKSTTTYWFMISGRGFLRPSGLRLDGMSYGG